MLSSRAKAVIKLLSIGLFFLCLGSVAYAASVGLSTSGIGGVAEKAAGSMKGIAKLITAGSYIAGLGFGVGAIVKFKAHKDAPTQVALSVPIALLFVAAALLFLPQVFKSVGGTMFASGETGGVSGITTMT